MASLKALRESTPDGTLPFYAWPGAYQMVYYTEQGGTICPKCANVTDTSDPVVAGEEYFEGPEIVCDDGSECGSMVNGTWQAGTIPSAYGDPDAPETAL